MVRYIFLVLLAIVTVWHLADSWRDDSRARKRTKPFLLLFILLYYIASADVLSWFLIAALVTSWLGDLLLMPTGNKWFVMGGISFMFSHFLFIAAYARHMDFSAVPRLPSVLVALVYLCVTAVILRLVQPISPKAMTAAVCAYLLANSCMNVFSAMNSSTASRSRGKQIIAS